MSGSERPGGGAATGSRVFAHTLLALGGIYVVLRYVLPWIPVWTGSREVVAPTPGFALVTYMICAALGALVYVSSDSDRWHEFRAPLVRLLALEPGRWWGARLVLLGLVPLLAGWLAWSRLVPSYEPPPAVRLQHPTIPADFVDRANPFRDLRGEEREDVLRTGTVLYQKNCRPCHGARADGDGPLARGLRLSPVDFTDPGTLASLIEQYPFWRISEGWPGLPAVATPWHSAMPGWAGELGPDEIWRIVMAEYWIAGREPRRPEGERHPTGAADGPGEGSE